MRVTPIITAIIVTAGLYLIIFERDRVLNFARGTDAEISTETNGTEMAGDTSYAAEASPPDNAQGISRVSVTALKSTAQEIDSAVLLRGRTEASRQVVLKAEISGLVVSEPIRKGAAVAMGDLLCQLDPGTSEANLAEARARLEEARARKPESEARVSEAQARVAEAEINLNAAEKLRIGGFASQTRVASAHAAVQSARAALVASKSGAASSAAAIQSATAGVAAAERTIERLKITAPFSGLLETDTAEIGSLLQPGSACATIVQIDPIMLVGFVPETTLDRVSPGVPAGGRLTNGLELMGVVTFLSRAADPLTRTFRVEVEVANPDQRVSDGLSVEILISSGGRRAHLLPGSSLTLDEAGNLGVRLVGAGDITRFHPVELIRDSIEGVWVAGLEDNVSVIIVGQEYVLDGAPLTVTYRDPDA